MYMLELVHLCLAQVGGSRDLARLISIKGTAGHVEGARKAYRSWKASESWKGQIGKSAVRRLDRENL